MRKIYILLLGTLMIIGCSDTTIPTNYKTEKPNSLNAVIPPEDEDPDPIDGGESGEGGCCNNTYPIGDGFSSPSMSMNLNKCSVNNVVTCLQCAQYWFRYAEINAGVLIDDEICYGTGSNDAAILHGETSNNNPFLTWDPRYCHNYIVMRKIGNGNWEQIGTVPSGCRSTGNGCNENPTFIDSDPDADITLNTSSIYYEVWFEFYGLSENGTNTVEYEAAVIPMTVTISGSNSLVFRETGTYSANTSGGNGSYSYQWYKQYLGSSTWYTRSAYQTNTETMMTSSFTLKVIVTSGGESVETTKTVWYELDL